MISITFSMITRIAKWPTRSWKMEAARGYFRFLTHLGRQVDDAGATPFLSQLPLVLNRLALMQVIRSSFVLSRGPGARTARRVLVQAFSGDAFASVVRAASDLWCVFSDTTWTSAYPQGPHPASSSCDIVLLSIQAFLTDRTGCHGKYGR